MILSNTGYFLLILLLILSFFYTFVMSSWTRNMKNCCRYILLVLFLFTGADLFASVYNGGLYFKSHSAPSVDRTSLTLNDDKPFDVSNEFTISFQMWVRNNEPDFGSILHLYTNTNQLVRFSFVAWGRRHYPALVFN